VLEKIMGVMGRTEKKKKKGKREREVTKSGVFSQSMILTLAKKMVL
jgi:hypothetical protein